MKKVTEEKNNETVDMKKPREKKFTLAEATKQLTVKKQKEEQEKQARLKAAGEGIAEILEQTNCSLIVNPNSVLNNLEIIVKLNN
jgi:hypothetical protein